MTGATLLPVPEQLTHEDNRQNDDRIRRVTHIRGLISEEAHQRLIRFGANHLRRKSRLREAVLLLSQFKSPIVLILLSASGLSFFLRRACSSRRPGLWR